MASWDDVSTVEQPAPQPANWDSVSTPDEVPKIPDTSGVQKRAADNLAANDNASTPMQRTEQAAGLPVSSIIGGTAKPTDIDVANRTQYIKALENGSAISGPDWMQTMLHAVAPIVLGGVQRAEHPLDFAAEAGNDVMAGFKGGAGLLMYPFLSDASKQELLKNNQLTDYQDADNPTFQEEHRRALELEGSTVGKAMGGLYAPMGALSPIISPIIQSTGGAPLKTGQLPTWQSNLPGDISAVMDVFGGVGVVHGAGELRAARTAGTQFAPGTGPWDNHPGADAILQAVADKHGVDIGKAPALADQTIGEGSKGLFPAAQDFKDVSKVSGIPESGLKTVYMETGVHPDQIFADAQHNPEIAQDVAAGKVPEAYQYRIEQKAEMAPDATNGMQVKADPDTKSFSVVDRDGDHVSGGFDSAEEAQHYIEDEGFKAQELAAMQSEPEPEPTEKTTPEQSTKNAPDSVFNGDIANNLERTFYSDEHDGSPVPLQNLGFRPEEIAALEKDGLATDGKMSLEQFGKYKKERSNPARGKQRKESFVDEKAIAESKALRTAKKEQPDKEREALSKGMDMWHGSDATEITETNREKAGTKTDAGNMGSGLYSSPSRMVARAYGKVLHSVKVFLKNPLEIVRDDNYQKNIGDAAKNLGVESEPKWSGSKQTSKAFADEFRDKAIAAGYDGAIARLPNNERSIVEAVSYNDEQAKFSGKTGNIITPSETGKVTSLRSFLSNNGAKFSEANELMSIKRNGEVIKGKNALEYAHEIANEQGYLPKDEEGKTARPMNDLQDALGENGGRDTTRAVDADRVAKAQEALEARKNFDPAKIEHEAQSAGIELDQREGETDRQYKARLVKALKEFYAGQEGSGPMDALRQAIGKTIQTAEKLVGKITGDFFEKLGQAYIKTFQPELMGPIAKRADAYMAKFKAKAQEAENSFYRQSADSRKTFARMSKDERMQWLYDHETGRWNEEDDPDHARFQAIYDAMHEAEQKAISAQTAYKENYLPHQWEDPTGVNKFFSSDAMIKKYGADWFKKASEFKLIQEGVRAGFKLVTDNPEEMLLARQGASDNMIRTMDLLKDMESSGIATKTTSFSIDKKIAKTETAINDVQTKYKSQLEDIEKQKSLVDENGKPIGKPISKSMKLVQDRLENLNERLESFKKEKKSNTLTSDHMRQLKDGFRVIGPDSKAWNIHQQAGPLWKNAMEMKGLWENQGATGDFYRSYMQGKAIWTQLKLGLSLFHPIHVAMIDLASDIAASADHLIQGGKLSDLATRETAPNLGLGKETLKGQDHPAVKAWNTIPEKRTPEQQQMVTRMVEGGFKPTMSARDTVHFRENFDKAIAGVGLNNLRLIGTAISLPGLVMKPFFEHWIPGMKSEIYLKRYQDALDRDPTLATDDGRRGEMARQISKDTDRTYGEMNNDVQFWNRNVRDSFNASFISGGWKLAQIYNARGLLTPAKIAYKFAKTGEFSKADITFNMLHAYAYTGLTLALGGAINKMLGNPIGTAKDTIWDIVKNLVAPQTGEKNPDGSPIRLNQPAFAKEGYNLAHEINTKGIIGGTGSFLYHQTLLPGIVDTLSNRDFTGREIISNPTDLHQWMNAGWESLAPISFSNSEKAEAKHSEVGKIAGDLGFPIAGAYLNQTPFEQKIIAKYDEENPPKGDVYSAKLKAEMKQAYANDDQKAVDKLTKQMQGEGMTAKEISNAKKVYTKPFAAEAWKKLSIEDQRQIIKSATPEERQKFKLKSGSLPEEE